MSSFSSPDEARGAPRIVCLSAREPSGSALATLVASMAAGASVEIAHLGTTLGAPPADLFVIDATGDTTGGREMLVTLRARGAGAPAIVIAEGAAGDAGPGGIATDGDDSGTIRGGDAIFIAAAELAQALPNAIGEAIRWRDLSAPGSDAAAVLEAVRNARQLIAAGQIARRVKHDLNNPLAALLAEAQMLAMEPLPEEQREAAERIVELCRRVVNVARSLEGPRADR